MLECTACRAALPPDVLAGQVPARCPRCEAWLEISVFPALFRPLAAGEAGQAVLSDRDAARAMARRAQERMKAHYGIEGMTRRYEELYERVLAGCRRGSLVPSPGLEPRSDSL